MDRAGGEERGPWIGFVGLDSVGVGEEESLGAGDDGTTSALSVTVVLAGEFSGRCSVWLSDGAFFFTTSTRMGDLKGLASAKADSSSRLRFEGCIVGKVISCENQDWDQVE